MKKIDSFKVDHLLLQAGIYISGVDEVGGEKVTTLDIRVVRPNYDTPMTAAIAHTIEHLGAFWLRNCQEIKDDILYFGPMGCLTGFYLLVARDLSEKVEFEKVVSLIMKMMNFVSNYNGSLEEMGFTVKECGNYTLTDLAGAKNIAANFFVMYDALGALCFEYPKEELGSSVQKTPTISNAQFAPQKTVNTAYCIPKPKLPPKFPDYKKMPIRTPEQLKTDLKMKTPLRNKRKPSSNELF